MRFPIFQQDLINTIIEVVIITAKSQDHQYRFETRILKSIVEDQLDNGNLKKINLSIHKLNNFFECLANNEIAKMLYILSLVKISTPHELREAMRLDIKSRETIQSFLIKSMKSGLVKSITFSHPEYKFHQDYWKKRHSRTNRDPPLYLATEDLFVTVHLYEKHLSSLLHKTDKKIYKIKGEEFSNYIISELDKKHEDNIQREKIVIEAIGACTRCNNTLTKKHKENKRCEIIQDKLYCKGCISEMFNDGTMKKLMKNC